MIVTLYLKIYTATLISFGLILVVGLVIVYINHIAPSVAPTQQKKSDIMFVHPSQITIVSIPVKSESKGESKEVKVEEINIGSKY